MPTSFDPRLARHGAIVLLLGLLIGFVITRFHDRGAGDAAHLVGLIGGFGLIGLSAIWPRLNVSRAWSTAGVWLIVICMYANWLGCVFLALAGGPAGPGAPAMASALPWDRAARILLFGAVWLSLLSALILLFGLFRRRTPATTIEPEQAAAQAHG